MGNQYTKLAKIFLKTDKNINIGFKTNNELKNLNNLIKNYSKLEKRGVYKLT